ncbi:MAG: peptidoglycan-binding protein [Candidatus Omnitrophica bacterium]|nr:peptidoglycan-binding protein [Candidatus Omnitrophota bacterium]
MNAPAAPQEASVDTMASTSQAPTKEQIQQALKNAGVYQGTVDGVLGPKTKKAIKAFQQQNGLNADGRVGKKTWAKLAPYLNSTPAATTAAPAAEPSN